MVSYASDASATYPSLDEVETSLTYSRVELFVLPDLKDFPGEC